MSSAVRLLARVFLVLTVVLGTGVALAWAWDRSDTVAAASATPPVGTAEQP